MPAAHAPPEVLQRRLLGLHRLPQTAKARGQREDGDFIDFNDVTDKKVNSVNTVPPMNEAETRAEHIDPALKAAGWGVVEGSRIRREYEIVPGRIEGQHKAGKRLKADYILEYRNTKLAVVEAKAWDEELTEGVAQAKLYAGKLAVRYACATNGQGIYRIDMQSGTEGHIPCYPHTGRAVALYLLRGERLA